jgi:hypothetical protein
VDLLIALLARPEVAFLDTTERRTSVSKLVEFTLEITNRECTFGSRLDLLQLIGASLNRDPLALAGEAFQFVRIARNRFSSLLVIRWLLTGKPSLSRLHYGSGAVCLHPTMEAP